MFQKMLKLKWYIMKLLKHVRPKAANSEDTFEFTNGLQITKRTFWANRETINELIQLYVNEKE